MSEQRFKVQPGTQPFISIWCRAAARAQRFDSISRRVFQETVLCLVIFRFGEATYIKFEEDKVFSLVSLSLSTWFQILDLLLHFKTTAPQMPNLGHISHFFNPWKNWGRYWRNAWVTTKMNHRHFAWMFWMSNSLHVCCSVSKPERNTFPPKFVAVSSPENERIYWNFNTMCRIVSIREIRIVIRNLL